MTFVGIVYKQFEENLKKTTQKAQRIKRCALLSNCILFIILFILNLTYAVRYSKSYEEGNNGD